MMSPFRLIDKIREIANREYSVDQYMIDDMLELFVPEIINLYRTEVYEQIAQETYGDAFDEGKEDARDEIRQYIRQMRSEGTWDEETLSEIEWSI